MSSNTLHEKSLSFAVRCVKFYKYLCDEKKEFVISKQLLRSGTSIGANIRESKNAESQQYFVHKLSIALKEADESQYWLELLKLSEIIDIAEFDSLYNDLRELVALLTSVVKSVKNKNAQYS